MNIALSLARQVRSAVKPKQFLLASTAFNISRQSSRGQSCWCNGVPPISCSNQNKGNHQLYLKTSLETLKSGRTTSLSRLMPDIKPADFQLKFDVYNAVINRMEAMQNHIGAIEPKKEAHVAVFLTPMFEVLIRYFKERARKLGFQIFLDVQNSLEPNQPACDELGELSGTMDLSFRVRTIEEMKEKKCVFDTMMFVELKRENPDKGVFQGLGYLENALATNRIKKPVYCLLTDGEQFSLLKITGTSDEPLTKWTYNRVCFPAEITDPKFKQIWLNKDFSLIVDIINTIVIDFLDITEP